MRAASLLTVALVSTIGLTGCGSDEADSGSSADTAVAATSSPTTTPPTTTPATTTTTTTAATTTVAAPTTLAAPDGFDAETSAAIFADYSEAMRLFYEALMDPSDPVATEAALARRAGDPLADAEGGLAQSARVNVKILPDPPVEPTITLVSGPDPSEEPGEAVMRVCEVNSWVTVEVLADGTNKVLDDKVYYVLWDIGMQLDGEHWILAKESQVSTDQGEGVTDCVE